MTSRQACLKESTQPGTPFQRRRESKPASLGLMTFFSEAIPQVLFGKRFSV